MADNPRQPEHHSNAPSYRPANDSPGPAGSSPGGNYSSSPHGGSSPGKVNYRNIILGAIVTIVTSTTVFLITQSIKKPEGDGSQSRKQATASAWNSYVGYENNYLDNLLSINKTRGMTLDSALINYKRESNKFQRAISGLAAEKKIDPDLKNVLETRLENEKLGMPVLEGYYANLKKINTNNSSPKEKITAIADEMSRYNDYTKGLYERMINDIRGIGEVLSKRYDQKFSLNDFQMVQLQPQMVKTNDSMVTALRNIEFDNKGQIINRFAPVKNIREEDIIGHWNSDGAVFTFEKNRKMTWVLAEQKAIGTWTIEGAILRLDGILKQQKGFWLFHVSNITENSLTLTSIKDEKVFYQLIRIIEQ